VTIRKLIFAIASGLVMLIGAAFTAYYAAWWGFRLDYFLGFSIALTVVGGVGLFTTLRSGRKSS
jgi:hypothetical protein